MVMVKTPGPKKEAFMVRFDEETGEKIGHYATENDMSKAAVVRKAVKEFFGKLIVRERHET